MALIAAVSALVGHRDASEAATTTTTVAVSATIAATCTISASNLNFGTYTGAQNDTTATVSATCTQTTPYFIGMNAGLNQADFYTPRMLGPASALLVYKLYRDAARTAPWGGTQNYDAVSGTGSGSAQTYTCYGREPAGQYVQPGSYSDTIQLAIVF